MSEDEEVGSADEVPGGAIDSTGESTTASGNEWDWGPDETQSERGSDETQGKQESDEAQGKQESDETQGKQESDEAQGKQGSDETQGERGSDDEVMEDSRSNGETADGRRVDDVVDSMKTVDPDAIDPAALTVTEQSLDPRIQYLWIVRAVVTAVVVGAVALGIDQAMLAGGMILPVATFLLVLVLGVVHAIFRYRIWAYEVREDALYLRRGVLTRVRTVVPFVRIQHVDTSRGPIERAIGLSSVVVYTAGSRGADVTIPGLTREEARDMQRRLKQLAIAAEGDTAV